MILEHALLPVRPGLEADFEAAFAQARPLIEAAGAVSYTHLTLPTNREV